MFESAKKFVQQFEEDLFFQLRVTFEEFGNILKEYITENQLYDQGIDGNKKKLRAYERVTVRIKISKGQPTDRTTLKDTGSFYNNIEITGYADNFEVSSNVPYDIYLLDKRESRNAYGFDVLKPTDQNMRDFLKDYFIPNFKKYIDDKRSR